MKDWKVRQEIYHRLNKTFDDDLNTKEIEMSNDIVGDAVRYFNERDIGWIYPAKSYMVGICYARWLSEYFGGEPLDYLKEQSLLFDNDPYFKNYDLGKQTYEEILSRIDHWKFNELGGMVPDVKSYFMEEFMI